MASRCTPIFCALVALLLVVPAWALELPVARLDRIFPPGGKAGTEVEVTLDGAELDEANALHFSHPGITATPKDKKFIVKIAADVPAGVYDVRVSGLFGISNPRSFVVGDLPEAIKNGTRNTPATAMEIPLDTTINGTVGGGTADYFKFTAKKGQRLMIESEAEGIDSRLIPALKVFDATGHEWEVGRRGGFLEFDAPADGSYLLEVHDLTFNGGSEHFYRLTLSTGPHLDFIFPPCGEPGKKGKFTLYGRNLTGGTPANLAAHDGKPLEKLDVEIDVPATADPRVDGLLNPAAATIEGFSYRLKSPHASNPVFIDFARGPVLAEHEPNDTVEHAQQITPPCEIAGQFFPAGDVDVYSFDAKKGDVWWLEITSQRFGLPTNPFLLIERDGGDPQEGYGAETNIGGVRFNTVSNDPALRFEAKADGTYRVKVRDLYGTARKDPSNVYNLSIRKASPDFRLLAVDEPPPETKNDRSVSSYAVQLRGAGTAGIRVLAFRSDGYTGPIELHAENLPAGVTCVPTVIPASATEGMVLLTCGDKPERWSGPIRIVGKARVGDADVTHEARSGFVLWSVTDTQSDAEHRRLTRETVLAVGVADAAPVTMIPAEDKRWEIPAGGKLEIPLKFAWSGEFKNGMQLKAAGAAGLDALKEQDVAANAATATATIDLAAAKLPASEYTIYFEGHARGKFRGKDVFTTIYSPPIRVAVQAALPK